MVLLAEVGDDGSVRDGRIGSQFIEVGVSALASGGSAIAGSGFHRAAVPPGPGPPREGEIFHVARAHADIAVVLCAGRGGCTGPAQAIGLLETDHAILEHVDEPVDLVLLPQKVPDFADHVAVLLVELGAASHGVFAEILPAVPVGPPAGVGVPGKDLEKTETGTVRLEVVGPVLEVLAGVWLHVVVPHRVDNGVVVIP